MAPMVHGLEAKYFGRIKFSYLDADDPQTHDFSKHLAFITSQKFTCSTQMEMS